MHAGAKRRMFGFQLFCDGGVDDEIYLLSLYVFCFVPGMSSGEQKRSVMDYSVDNDRVVCRLCFIVGESVGNGVLYFDIWSRLVHPCGVITTK